MIRAEVDPFLVYGFHQHKAEINRSLLEFED